jgi:hypothetical protein
MFSDGSFAGAGGSRDDDDLVIDKSHIEERQKYRLIMCKPACRQAGKGRNFNWMDLTTFMKRYSFALVAIILVKFRMSIYHFYKYYE